MQQPTHLISSPSRGCCKMMSVQYFWKDLECLIYLSGLACGNLAVHQNQPSQHQQYDLTLGSAKRQSMLTVQEFEVLPQSWKRGSIWLAVTHVLTSPCLQKAMWNVSGNCNNGHAASPCNQLCLAQQMEKACENKYVSPRT